MSEVLIECLRIEIGKKIFRPISEQKKNMHSMVFDDVCRKSPNRAVVLVAFVLNPLSAGGCPVPDFCKSSSQRHLRGPKTRTPEGKMLGQNFRLNNEHIRTLHLL